MKKVFLTIGLLSMTNLAFAIPVALDFSAFSSQGQSYEGVTVADITFTSETGNLIYTNSYGGGLHVGVGGASDTYMDFSTAIDSFSVRAGDGAGDLDAFGVSAYEFGTNNFLGTFTSPQFGGPNEPEWYTLNINLANIGRIVFDPCNSGSCPGSAAGAGGVVITDVWYNTVAAPEPGSIALLVLGLSGLMYRRRQRILS